MDKERFRLAIIGGGASGMLAAISAAMILPGRDIVLLEKNQELGKKLLATGNGHCNLSNLGCRYMDYQAGGSIAPRQILSKISASDTIAFFDEIGLMTREDDDGRVYPYTEQAATVRDLLVKELKFLGVSVRTSSGVSEIRSDETVDPSFSIHLSSGDSIKADAVVVATGGKAGSQFGSDGDGYGFAKSFGHTLIRPRPGLVSLIVKEWNHKELKGVRVKCSVALERKGERIVERRGELQFTDYGISGICIFDISRFLDVDETEVDAIIDFFPDLAMRDLAAKLFARAVAFSTRSPESLLEGMLHQKLIPFFLPDGDDVNPEQLARVLKSWRLPIEGTKGWKEAQVTVGGVNCEELYQHTLGSRKKPGLYFAGEVLDVDGPCGGWNLQWAWSSGFAAGESAALWAAGIATEGEDKR